MAQFATLNVTKHSHLGTEEPSDCQWMLRVSSLGPGTGDCPGPSGRVWSPLDPLRSHQRLPVRWVPAEGWPWPAWT